MKVGTLKTHKGAFTQDLLEVNPVWFLVPVRCEWVSVNTTVALCCPRKCVPSLAWQICSPSFKKGCQGQSPYLWMSLFYGVAAMSYFYARCQCRIICCRVKSATLTFTSPPPLSARSTQVCTIMCADAEAWMCEWGCLLLHHPPIGVAGIQRSVSMCRGPISASAAATVGAFSSASSLHQPQQHHSTFESIHFSQAAQHGFPLRILPSSLHEPHETAAAASHSGLIHLPLPPLLLRWVRCCNCPSLPSSSSPSLSEVLQKKQASCLFLRQKRPSAGQLVFRCPSGGWSCGWRQKRWPWGSCWRDWGQSSKP